MLSPFYHFCLLQEYSTIETMPWYRILATYADKARSCGPLHSQVKSMTSDGNSAQTDKSLEDENRKDILKSDPDYKLLSLVIEKVVVVRVTNFVKAAYDPLSTSQTLKLTGLLERFIETYPTLTGESRQVREVLEMVKDKLKAAIDNDVYIPVGYPKHLLENPLSGHAVFLQRQFWGAFKLYRNVLAWHGILSDVVVAEMALNSILNRYMVIGLGVMVACGEFEQVINKCRHIVGALPAPWVINQKQPTNHNPSIHSVIYKIGLGKFAKFLGNIFGGKVCAALPTNTIEHAIKLLRIIGAKEEAETMRANLLERT